MKKHLLLVGTLAISMLSAQNNEGLKREFEKQNKENNAKFDSYVAKRFGNARNAETQKLITELRANLAGFSGDIPNFYETDDQNQIKNNNVDALTTAGGVNGLTTAFNGEGIKYTIFDGGRIYAAHEAFNNLPGRITNKEADTNIHSSHSTGVASIIGAKSSPLTSTDQNGNIVAQGNAIGIAINSTMDSYRFAQTTLPGSTTPTDVFAKILIAQPKISNHSYGVNPGWTYGTTSAGYPANAWYWNGNYISGNNYNQMGTYNLNDKQYDAIVYNNPAYTIVKSAGNYYNYGPGYQGTTTVSYYQTASGFQLYPAGAAPAANCAQGFDCIGYGSLAKNIIVVGATNVITTNNYKYTAATDVVKAEYSNAGPRDDGGIKPDISAPGTDIWMASTAETTAGSLSWQINSGTSMAAPQVAGIIGLWSQIHKTLFNNAELNAAASKTLMVHSALEAGNVGPDVWYGWGFIDAKKGAELLVGKSNNTVIFNNETLTNGTTNTKFVKAIGGTPLKVTISWIDPEFTNITNMWDNLYNNRVSRLINDLDVRVTDLTTNTTNLPWKLNVENPMALATKGDNTVDNVEQVVIDNPIAGRTYKIEISHKGTLLNNAVPAATTPQNYSIIVTGHNEVLGTKESATNALSNLAVAPSITKDVTNILNAPKKSTFNVYDLSGKKLQSGNINSDKEAINLSSYTKGIYIIEVKTEKDVVAKKVIKE